MICDNLNTHKIALFYVAFKPAEAKCLCDRLEIHYTLKHGGWLNIAEIELGLLTRQCLQRHIPTMSVLQQHAQVWYERRNESQKSVDWQFTCEDARVRLKRLYPQF